TGTRLGPGADRFSGGSGADYYPGGDQVGGIRTGDSHCLQRDHLPPALCGQRWFPAPGKSGAVGAEPPRREPPRNTFSTSKADCAIRSATLTTRSATMTGSPLTWPRTAIASYKCRP